MRRSSCCKAMGADRPRQCCRGDATISARTVTGITCRNPLILGDGLWRSHAAPRLQLDAVEIGFGHQNDAELRLHALHHVAGELGDIISGGAAAIGDGERVLGRDRRP